MQTVKEAAAAFLNNRRIAVSGVSGTPQAHGSNIVFGRLRERGYDVFAVNPDADDVEGTTIYRDLASIPGGVDAVVIGMRPDLAVPTMQQCIELGIKHVWIHHAFGPGSVSAAATELGRSAGINVIDGGCPLMFGATADFGHKCIRAALSLTGVVPR
jgi:predicted CoA-binding protein